jgi:hypothetical protein
MVPVPTMANSHQGTGMQISTLMDIPLGCLTKEMIRATSVVTDQTKTLAALGMKAANDGKAADPRAIVPQTMAVSIRDHTLVSTTTLNELCMEMEAVQRVKVDEAPRATNGPTSASKKMFVIF